VIYLTAVDRAVANLPMSQTKLVKSTAWIDKKLLDEIISLSQIASAVTP